MAASGLTLDQLQALQAARGSPAFPSTGPSGNGVGARTQLSDVQTRLFLQRAQQQQQQQQQMPLNNGNNMNLSRDAMAALQHAAQVAVVQQNLQNQASMKQQQQFHQGGVGQGASNLQVHQQLQAALQAQLQQQQQAARLQQQGQPQQQQHPLNSPAAMFLMQNQLQQQQQQQYSMQSSNPTAAAAAAAQQGRALPNGGNNLLQLQQAAADIQAGRPPINWSKHVLQNPPTTLQQQQAQQAQQMAAAQSNPGLLAAALQRHAAANIQSQMQAAQAAQVRGNAMTAAATNNNSTPAAQLQMLRQLHARYAQAQAGSGVDPGVLNRAAAMAAQAAQQQQAQLQAQQLAQQQAQQQASAQKHSSAQLQALRQALSRNAAGRAALNAANDHLRGNAPRGGAVNMQQLNMQATAQMIMQQQRTAQQQAQANASMVQNLANLQHGRSAADRAATNQQMLHTAAMQGGQQRGPGLPQPPHMQQVPGGAQHQQPQLGLDQFDVTQAQMLINSLQQAKSSGLEPRPASANGTPYLNGSQHSSNPGSPPGGPSGNGPLANGSLASKEQRRLALACVALQLARGGMTVQQAIDNGIMGGMSGTDVNFIIECYNAENARMKGDPNSHSNGGMAPQSNSAAPGFSNPNGQHGLAFQQTNSLSGSDISRLQTRSQASSQFGSPPNSDASASVFEPQGHSPKDGSYSSSNSPPPGSHPFLHQGASSYLTQRSLTEAAAAQPLPRGNTGSSLDSSTTSGAGDRPTSGDPATALQAQSALAEEGADGAPPPGRFDAFVYDFFGGEIPAGMDGELEALQSLSAGQLGGELGGALEDEEGSEGARADDALEEEMLSLIGSDSGEHDDLGSMHNMPTQQQHQFFQQSKQAMQYGGGGVQQYGRMPQQNNMSNAGQQGMMNGGQQGMMNGGQQLQQQRFPSQQASDAAVANAAAVMNAVQQGGRSSAGEVLSRMDAEQLAQFALSPEVAWLQAAAIANKAMWEGGEDEEPLSNDDLDLRLANLDLGSGFF